MCAWFCGDRAFRDDSESDKHTAYGFRFQTDLIQITAPPGTLNKLHLKSSRLNEVKQSGQHPDSAKLTLLMFHVHHLFTPHDVPMRKGLFSAPPRRLANRGDWPMVIQPHFTSRSVWLQTQLLLWIGVMKCFSQGRQESLPAACLGVWYYGMSFGSGVGLSVI